MIRTGVPAGQSPLVTWLRGAFCATLLLRLGYPFFNSPLNHLFSDPKRHWDNALAFLHPGMFGSSDPFLYQLWLFLLQRLAGEHAVILMLGCGLLCALLPYAWYRALRELMPREWAFAGALLIGLNPGFLGIYGYFMNETLLLPLVAIAFWLTFRAGRKAGVAAFACAAGFWLAAAFTRTAALPIALVALSSVLLFAPKPALKVLCAGVLFCVLAVPAALRSEINLGFYAPFGNLYLHEIYRHSGKKTIELDFGPQGHWGFGSPSFYNPTFYPFSDWLTAREGAVRVHIDTTQGRTDWILADAKSREQRTLPKAQDLLENLAFLSVGPSWPDNDLSTAVGWLTVWTRWVWVPLLLAVTGGAIQGRFRGRELLLPATALLLWMWLGFQQQGITEGRFRKPIEPILLAAAVVLAYRMLPVGIRLMRLGGIFAQRHWAKPQAVAPLIAILAFAFVLRLAVIIVFPSLHHPDENFQFLEQSHRLAFGYGIVPWEFHDGIRSLLLPAAFAKLFLIADRWFGGPQAYLLAARVALASFSLIAVAAVYELGARLSRTHALIGGIVAASWFELIYFSIRPLTEGIAATFLILALAAATKPAAATYPTSAYSARRLLLIGFSLAMCLMLRVHFAVGLMLVTGWVLRHDWRARWRYLLLGALAPLVAFGVSDWITWGAPFHSQWAAFHINVIEGQAAHYGVESPLWYLSVLGHTWIGALPVLLGLILLGWRRYKLWILVALSIIASHSLIDHKEYRFVAPAFSVLAIVAGLSSADALEWLRPRVRKVQHAWLALGVAALWVTTSWSLGAAPRYVENWTRGRGLIEAFGVLSREPRLCGLLLYEHPWYDTGGYAYLHRDIPIYETGYGGETASPGDRVAYNFVILRRASTANFAPEFTEQRCIGGGDSNDICLVARPGGCEPSLSAQPLTQVTGLGR